MWLALSRVAAQWRQELKPFVSASDPGAVAQEPRTLLNQQTHTPRAIASQRAPGDLDETLEVPTERRDVDVSTRDSGALVMTLATP